MKKTALLVLLIVLSSLGTTAALAQGTVQGSQNIGIVTMNAQNGSGQDGSATLSEENGKLTVTLEVQNGTAGPQPAHIHKGTCANLDPTPAFPLTPVVNGKSVTILDLTLGDLMSQPYAINIHKSTTEAQIYVSCGDLTMMARAGGLNPGAGGTPGMPTAGNPIQPTLPALLGLLALLIIFAGTRLARRSR